MKNKFSIAMSLAVILSMLLTSLALADTITTDGDIVNAGPNLSVTTCTADVSYNGSATINYQGSQHFAAVGGTLNVAYGADAPLTVTGPATKTLPGGWDTTTDVFTFGFSTNVPAGISNGTYKVNITVSGPKQGGGTHTVSDFFNVNVNCPTAPVDSTAPTASPVQSPAANLNGWNNTDVTVNWNWSDNTGGSGIDSANCTTNSVSSGEGTLTLNATCKDLAGNTGSASYTVKVDKTGPSVSCDSADGLWHASDVSIACTASDGISGLVNSADASFSLMTNVSGGTEDENASTDSRTIYDLAGNSAVGGPVSGNMVDKMAPAVSCGTADAAWHGSDVSIACTASDGGSGLADAADASFFLTTNLGSGMEDPNVSTDSRTVYDVAGNFATAGPVSGNMIDKKAPVFSSCDAPDGLWHNDNVTLNCSYTDGGSGAGNLTVALTTGIAAGSENANASASAGGAQSCDAVGNCADSPSDISGNMIDRKAPTGVTFVGGIADGGTYYFGFVPAAPTCTAADGGSGLASCNVTGYSTAIGGHTLTATATDNVGNSSTATMFYTISAWTLKGFYQPVDMGGVFNTVKNGSTVPLKFEIFAGPTELMDVSAVDTLSINRVGCTTGAVEDAIELTATGGTSLRYDATGGQFIYNWKTPTPAGPCYQITLKTDDGSILTALFKLK
jgi:hypothetical protein